MVPPGIIALLKRKRAQEVVHVPKIIPRIYKQVVEEPIPKTLEEIVQVPKIIQLKIIQQQCITQQHDEMTEKAEEERLAAEKTEQAKKAALKAEEERLAAEKAEQVQLRIQSLEERLQSLVDTSTFVDEVFAEMEEVPIPMTQEEIIQEPKFIQQTELGRVLPFSPKTRDLHMQVFFQVLPSVRYAWITP